MNERVKHWMGRLETKENETCKTLTEIHESSVMVRRTSWTLQNSTKRLRWVSDETKGKSDCMRIKLDYFHFHFHLKANIIRHGKVFFFFSWDGNLPTRLRRSLNALSRVFKIHSRLSDRTKLQPNCEQSTQMLVWLNIWLRADKDEGFPNL